MDLVSVVLPAVSLALQVLSSATVGNFSSASYQTRRFRRIGGAVLAFLFMHSNALSTVEHNINMWYDDEIKTWKQAYLSSCNISSVAVRAIHTVWEYC